MPPRLDIAKINASIKPHDVKAKLSPSALRKDRSNLTATFPIPVPPAKEERSPAPATKKLDHMAIVRDALTTAKLTYRSLRTFHGVDGITVTAEDVQAASIDAAAPKQEG